MTTRQKITASLWFNFNAEGAVNHYLSIFKGHEFWNRHVLGRPLWSVATRVRDVTPDEMCEAMRNMSKKP